MLKKEKTDSDRENAWAEKKIECIPRNYYDLDIRTRSKTKSEIRAWETHTGERLSYCPLNERDLQINQCDELINEAISRMTKCLTSTDSDGCSDNKENGKIISHVDQHKWDKNNCQPYFDNKMRGSKGSVRSNANKDEMQSLKNEINNLRQEMEDLQREMR